MSERRACRVVPCHRSVARYESRRGDDRELREQLHELAAQFVRLGYRMLNDRLRRRGIVVNDKKIYRLYREEGLQIRRRRRRRRRAAPRIPMTLPTSVNQRWSMDFMTDTLANGRSFRTFNVLDDFSRESLVIDVAFSISGEQVCRILDRIALTRGYPEAIVMDNGPEFTSRALDVWAYTHGVELRFIQPGKPNQNAFIESFNNTFRNSCLNENWFLDLHDARQIIEAWRIDYNEERGHTSLGRMTPVEFAAAAALQSPTAPSVLLLNIPIERRLESKIDQLVT